MTPSKQDITRFLECFKALDVFNSQSEFVRGYGAFNKVDWPSFPDPSVSKVINWLEELSKEG